MLTKFKIKFSILFVVGPCSISGGHHLVLKFFYLMSLHIVTVETVVLSSVLISSKSGYILNHSEMALTE